MSCRTPLILIADADRDLLPAGENVELGQEEIRERVRTCRRLHDERIEPAASTLTSRGGAEFGADLRKLLTVVVSSSVGIGPPPTRVVYALAIPTTRSMRVGPTPVPTHAPPAIGFEDVTYG